MHIRDVFMHAGLDDNDGTGTLGIDVAVAGRSAATARYTMEPDGAVDIAGAFTRDLPPPFRGGMVTATGSSAEDLLH